MRSLSEIETTSKRASRSIGFSWGEAEEISKGIRLLELFGFPGIKNLNQYYKDRKKKIMIFSHLLKKITNQENYYFVQLFLA